MAGKELFPGDGRTSGELNGEDFKSLGVGVDLSVKDLSFDLAA